MKTNSGFTLIELLVVIAVIAVLATVVIVVLNPAELLRESRDANRLSDIKTIRSALNIYSEDIAGGSLGSTATTYISIPDPNATSTAGDQCQGLGMSALPSGNWQCAASTTYRFSNNAGWVPVDLTQISSGNPLAEYPVDPTNQTSSDLFYTYQTNGSLYELTAKLESQKYEPAGQTDGGQYSDLYENGSSLALTAEDFGGGSTSTEITFDASSSMPTNPGDVVSVSWSHTTSGSNRLLYCGVEYSTGYNGGHVVSMTYNGTALTGSKLVAGTSTNNFLNLWLGYLVAPATGNNTVQVTFNQALGDTNLQSGGCISFDGVNQTTPLDSTSTFAAASTSSLPAHITTANNNAMVVDALAINSAACTFGLPAPQVGWGIKPHDSAEPFVFSYQGPVSSAGSVSDSFTATGGFCDVGGDGDFVGAFMSFRPAS